MKDRARSWTLQKPIFVASPRGTLQRPPCIKFVVFRVCRRHLPRSPSDGSWFRWRLWRRTLASDASPAPRAVAVCGSQGRLARATRDGLSADDLELVARLAADPTVALAIHAALAKAQHTADAKRGERILHKGIPSHPRTQSTAPSWR